MISKRVRHLQESVTLKLNATVNRMKEEGKDIYNLTAGEPDFPPPEAAKKAAIIAVEKNLSKYTPTPGILELRELIAKKTNAQQPSLSQAWKASNVVVTNGGKQAIFDALFSMVDEGDEVIIPAPFWISYPEQVKAAGGTSVIAKLTAEEGYRLSGQALEKLITKKTKLLILNSPSNPTGAMYTKSHFQELGSVLKNHPEIWILSDEIYDLISFRENAWCSFLEANPSLQNRTITVNGLSKSGAMTGWRVGWSVTPESLTPSLISLQGHLTSGICSLSQAAAVATLKLPISDFEPQRLKYLHRRNLALEVLRKSAKIEWFEPEGAFYLFLELKKVLKDNQDANGFAEALLRDVQVAVVPGGDFGAPSCIRISFAIEDETLKKACELLVQYADQNRA